MTERGEYYGKCFLGDCQSELPATWLNHFTKKYYCPACAARLNGNKANAADAQKMFGHELCTEVVGKEKQWTPKMDHDLRQMYPVYPAKALMEHFGVSENAIKKRASKLGVHRKPKGKQWTESENYRISTEAAKYTESQLANRLNVSVAVLRKQMRKLDVKPLSQVVPPPAPKEKKERYVRKTTKSGGINTSPSLKLKQLGKQYSITTNGTGQAVILLGKNTQITVRDGKDPEEVAQRFLNRDIGKKQEEAFTT